MPLDTVKTTMQLKTPLICQPRCVRARHREDGRLRGLYSGFQPFLFQASGKAAVRFFMFENIVRAVDLCGIDRAAAPARWSAICGLGAGMCEALFWTAPTERLKVLRQASAGLGTKGAGRSSLYTLVREQGIGGLYVGALPTAARQASSTAIRFATLDKLKTAACTFFGFEKKTAPWWVTFFAGGAAGSVSAVLNNPIDVVKSRIQSRTHGDSGVLACVRDTLKEGGVQAFGAGLQARCTRLFVSQAIQFSIVDQLTRRLFRPPSPPPPPPAPTPVVGFATALPHRHPSVLAPPPVDAAAVTSRASTS